MKIYMILLTFGICLLCPLYTSTLGLNRTKRQSPSCGISKGRLNSQNCSLSYQSVVNGLNAAQMAWPWQLSMYYNGQRFCGAILIHPYFALTAAHCTNGKYPNYMSFSGGFNNLRESKSWVSGVARLSQHPYYNTQNQDSDISIIQFISPAPLNDRLNTVCLPKQGEMPRDGEACYATGWGQTNDYTKDIEQNLQETCLPLLNWNECIQRVGIQTQNMVCAGGRASSVCFGDSGGPLVSKRGNSWVVLGISNWVVNCQVNPAYPSVFAKVPNFVNWIQETMRRSGFQ